MTMKSSHRTAARPRFLVSNSWLILLALMAVAISFVDNGTPSAGAAGGTGYPGPSFAAGVSGASPADSPTAEKPQSKLWYNDGTWWGVLFDRTSTDYHIYKYSAATQEWTDTGVLVDTRRYSHADALWDGSHLYVATAVQPGKGSSDLSARVLRYSYSPSTQSYSLDGGFPVVVASVAMEAITIDKDSTGMLWATYTATNASGGRDVYVTHSNGGDGSWVAPYVLPANGTNNLSSDDISALVAFSGQIGIMWSNQADSKMYWATHADGTPDSVWQINPALQDPNYADDHINLKSLQADTAGRVFAAVKTSLQDIPGNAGGPQLLLLILDNTGSWQRRTFGTVSENHTRPIVLIDESSRTVYMFATTNNGNPASSVVYKQASLDNINFPAGQGTPFIQSATDTNINNATSKKGSTNSTTGLVVLASDLTTGNYWFNTMGIGAPAPTAVPTATSTPSVGGNLALAKAATSSSVESSSYPAGAAVDGNGTTRWSSGFSDPQWIQVDLGGSYSIDRVKLTWEAAYGRAYKIQLSSDGASWTDIFSTTTGDGGVDDLAVSGTGRYVRMYGTARATPYGYSLWEMEVYGTASTAPTATPVPPTDTPIPTETPVPPTATAVPPTATAVPATATPTSPPTVGSTSTPTPVTATNLAIGRPATASSVESKSLPASRAVDGKANTRWSSRFSDPQWIQVDLGGSYSIDRVKLTWEAAYGRAYKIQLSSDGASWTDIFSTTTGDGGVDDLAVSGTGRYVRMYGTARATPYGYSLWEMEVYGK